MIILSLLSGYMNSYEIYQPIEFKPEYEEPKPRIQNELPIRVHLCSERGLA